MKRTFPCFFMITVLLSACASTRSNSLLSQEPDAKINSKEVLTLSTESNALWHQRNSIEALNEFIRIQKRICRSKDAKQEDLVHLSRAYFLKAEYFTVDPRQQSFLWIQAANWAEKSLTFNAAFQHKILTEKTPTEQALELLDKNDSEGLYWFAVGLGRWAINTGLKTELKYKERIKKMIERVAALNPDYFYGAIFRFKGVYFASLPGFSNEDLKNSKLNFENAIKKAPNCFLNHVLFAEYYAKKVDDMNLYKRHLEFVANGNPNAIQELVPEQMLEQARAKKLLEGLKK